MCQLRIIRTRIILDKRTAEWPLVQSPWNPILAVCCYLYLSLNAKILTEKMRTYQLKAFIIGYNAFMVLLSAYMAIEVSLSNTILSRSVYTRASAGIFCKISCQRQFESE